MLFGRLLTPLQREERGGVTNRQRAPPAPASGLSVGPPTPSPTQVAERREYKQRDVLDLTDAGFLSREGGNHARNPGGNPPLQYRCRTELCGRLSGVSGEWMLYIGHQ